jgi:hypothetical protein
MSYKCRLFRFVPSRETFRDPVACPRPIRAKYRGRAVFTISEN